MKLTQFRKMKIKFEEFTAIDKLNIVDLFVNNSKVVQAICDALFGEDLS